jgi:hypothetical protein
MCRRNPAPSTHPKRCSTIKKLGWRLRSTLTISGVGSGRSGPTTARMTSNRAFRGTELAVVFHPRSEISMRSPSGTSTDT